MSSPTASASRSAVRSRRLSTKPAKGVGLEFVSERNVTQALPGACAPSICNSFND